MIHHKNKFLGVKHQNISEEFICYLWKFQLLDLPLISTDKKTIMVKSPGIRNTDGGPDFSNGLIKIGTTMWAGHIEIHTKSSDWIKHRHHQDRKYENVILHVVIEDDLGNEYENFQPVATFEIKNKFSLKRFSKYQGFIQNQGWIACEKSIHQISDYTKSHFLQRLAIERLERKFSSLTKELSNSKSDFEQLFYIELFKSFGFKTNRTSFELLSKSIPLSILLKTKTKLNKTEALLFGQAGMLNINSKDEYFTQLKTEYEFLKHKHELKSISSHLWQYLRLRPSNFPDIRIAQLAVLLNKHTNILSKILEAKNIDQLLDLFKIKASTYWDTHYHFNKTSSKRIKKLGSKTSESIIINCIIPILFIYGHLTAKDFYKERALEFLEKIKEENNAITKKWKGLYLPTNDALHTQALLELKTQYCDFKRCLDCEFGCEILNIN